jgi:integrase
MIADLVPVRAIDGRLTDEAAALVADGQSERDETLTEEAAELISQGLAANTRAAYERIAGTYREWCEATGRTAVPATEATLANFVAYLATTPTKSRGKRKGGPRSPGSIDQALACVLAMHDHARAPKPGTKAARLALRAYRKKRASQGYRKRKSPPITLPVLRQLIEATPADTPTGVRDRAALVLGFALMGRRSEMANCNISDLVFTGEGVEVYIAQSKTDQDAQGETIPIPYGTHPETDPVRVLRAWLVVLAEHGITSGPLMRYVDKHGRIAGATYAGGKRISGRLADVRITGHGLNLVVKRAALLAALDNASAYSWHGLRSGGATSAAKNGAPMSAITSHGRWSEGSPVVAGYIRQADRWNDNPMRGIGL